jgi:PAS domain S-box-containing protein
MAEAQLEIADTLEPAGNRSSRLSLLKARQMARLEGFLLTGDRTFREPYIASIDEEDVLFGELGVLARGLDFEVRERLAELSAESTRWHFENQQLFDSIFDPAAAASARETSRSGFDQLEVATRELDRAIQSEVREGRRRMERLRVLQTRITIGLAVLALWAVFVLGRLGRSLRGLTTESEMRRRDAVRARREIDALVDATGDGVLGIDLDGKCTSLNPAGVELLGYTDREIQGRDVHDTIYHTRSDGTRRAREDSPLLEALTDGTAVDSEAGDILWRRRRVSFPARWSLRPLIDGVELRGAVLTFTDMTEIEEKEAALRLAIRQREDVVSIVSHDLRNPLGVVFGAADILLELPLDEEQRKNQAKIISRSAGRMKSLIDDLLDVSRIEAGALVVRRAGENLTEILLEARGLFVDQAMHKNVSLVIEEGPSRPEVEARVDRDRILQALANLLDNALRLTPGGGRITLGAREVGASVELSVSDTGPGIEADKLDHLFDRFWQADDGVKGGAGLGLAIVKGVAVAHGGDVAVRSEIGSGTTFLITIPRTKERVGTGGT